MNQSLSYIIKPIRLHLALAYAFSFLCILTILAYNNGGRNSQILSLPRHRINTLTKNGSVIFTRLTNTTNHSITLHPLLGPQKATDSASLIQGLLAQLTPSTDKDNIRIQLIQIAGRYIKSPNKVSIFPNIRDDNNDMLIRKEYSLIGSDFSLPSWHCDNFCKEAIYLLEATKCFSDSDFILEHCKIHTTMQVKLLNGDTVFVDMAVGTPVFMIANPAKKHGWASLSDILNNTDLVTEQSRYLYAREQRLPIDICVARTIANYKQVLQLSWHTNNYSASLHSLYNFSGDFILAPGQSIEYRDTLGYIIDTTQNGFGAMIDADMQKVAQFGVMAKINGNPAYWDSAHYYLYKPYSDILNISIPKATVLFNDGKILLYSSTDTNWTPARLPQQSVLYSLIPPSSDTLYYGVQTSLPFLITGSAYVNAGTLIDSFATRIYGNTMLGTVPVITGSQYNYANGIGIFRQIPPNTSVTQALLYNYNVFDFYSGGPMFLASDSGIKIEYSQDAVQKKTNPHNMATR